ncbi:MAG: 4-phosphoerythronate dehydrogenase [Rikenellaceae bacterium]
MKIVIDSAIPFLEGLFEPYADVRYAVGREFTPDIIRDADALIIRTRTKCDAALLEGSNVSHIATATIGYDHIDLDYCRERGIAVTTAAGCNARGVLQWIGAALVHLSRREGWQPQERRIGVVGVGNVGRLIVEYCRAWGFDVVCCDPPRALTEEGFVELDELLGSCDIVSLHTPLDTTTYHLLNTQNIKLLKPHATIINTSRGECIESEALLSNPDHKLLIDVWENEPKIDRKLLHRAVISTPHIAGYSIQGKANGSAITAKSITEHFSLPIERSWYPAVMRNDGVQIEWEELTKTIAQHFDIEGESAQLKLLPEAFESLRNNYEYRNEYF